MQSLRSVRNRWRPCPNVPDAIRQVCMKATLVHATIPTCGEDGRQQLSCLKLAHYQDFCSTHVLPQKTSHLQSADAGHADIEEDQVGQEFDRFLKRF